MEMEQYGNNENMKPLEICSHHIYLNIWDEFETSLVLKMKFVNRCKM